MLKSPINYIGNKYSLLPQLLPLLPQTKNFIDLFGGSFTLGINMDSEQLYYNEYDEKVFNLIRFLCQVDPDDFLCEVDEKIELYGLNKTNKESFYNFRDFYNHKESTELNLFILLCFSYNHQIRFNRKGFFNTPHGTGTTHFSSTMRNNFVLFNEKAKQKSISFSNKDFNLFDVGKLVEDTLVYCDPPYLISLATYNENGAWNLEKEKSLLDFLNNVNALGKKFALSNLTHHKGEKNDLLLDWIEKNGYHISEIRKKYKSQKTHKNTQKTREVLVTNY